VEQFANRTVCELFGKSLSLPSSNFFPEFANCLWSLFTYNPAAQQALKGKKKQYFFYIFFGLGQICLFLKQISRTSSRTIPELLPEMFGLVRTRTVEVRVRLRLLIFKKAHL
jgi:hypothetical protein